MPGKELGRKQRDFENTVLHHTKSLFYTAYNLTGDIAYAEDLIQETLLKAYNSFSSFRMGTNSRAWLTRIMINTHINNYHKAKREVDWEAFEDSFSVPANEYAFNQLIYGLPETEILRDWVDDEIRSALNRLPSKYRNAVIMFDLQGHSYRELAETFNCAIGTIKSRLFRGRTILKKLLANYARRRGFLSLEAQGIN